MIFSESLKKNRDFQKVYQTGKSKANKYLILYCLENGSERNRIGISASKKVGNSVVRHRMCRLIRESYRLNEGSLKAGYDFVCVVRPQGRDKNFHEIESALIHLMRLFGLLEEKDNHEKNIDRND